MPAVEGSACGTPVSRANTSAAAREVIDRPAAGRLVPRDPAAIAAAGERPARRAPVRRRRPGKARSGLALGRNGAANPSAHLAAVWPQSGIKAGADPPSLAAQHAPCARRRGCSIALDRRCPSAPNVATKRGAER